MWTWIAISVLASLIFLVLIRNLFIRKIILKRYNTKEKRNLYKQILKNNIKFFENLNFSELSFTVKSDLWATKVKIFFEVSFIQEGFDKPIKGTIFFDNQTNKKDINESINGVVIGQHAKYWF